MRKALVVTIGTEIACGEVVNSNAAWVSCRLEALGFRVYGHLTVRDHEAEILAALKWASSYEFVVVTGGLGPTSDDITRACVARHCARKLEFDRQVWKELGEAYVLRQLPLREAHRHQCHFPEGSERLKNPTGTALGFRLTQEKTEYVVLPGPPRELEGMWLTEVEPRLKDSLPPVAQEWVRWTCLGAPESEIAELVEPVIRGRDIEVGYRAQIPYVKLKVFVDRQAQSKVLVELERVLAPFIVARGEVDLAEELLTLWPYPRLEIEDEVSDGRLVMRLLEARQGLPARGPQVTFSGGPLVSTGVRLSGKGEEFLSEMVGADGQRVGEKRGLPYKLNLSSERGKRAACEWAIWSWVKALRRHSST